MQLYRIKRHTEDAPAYAGTMAVAKVLASREKHRRDITLGQIDLIDIALDKDTILQILNGDAHPEGKRLRSWKVTDRGGVREIGA